MEGSQETQSDFYTVKLFKVNILMSLWTLFTLYNYRIAALVKRPFFIIHFPTHSATEHNKRRFKMTQSANSDIFDWSQPSTDGKHLTGLVINNSFTKSKVPFVPEVGMLYI